MVFLIQEFDDFLPFPFIRDPTPPLQIVPTPKLYIHKAAVEMVNALDERGREVLAEYLSELEISNAPKVNVSRLERSLNYKTTSYILLSQLNPDLIKSVLENRLFQDICTEKIQLPIWNRISVNANEDDIAPGIYVNFLCPWDGTGMTIPEYERMIEAMEEAIEGRNHMDEHVDQIYLARRRGLPISSNGLMPRIREENTFHENFGEFKAAQEDMLYEAMFENATEVRIPGEVGWAKNVHVRAKEHELLINSPTMLQLADCVLGHLYPRRYFRIHSVFLFTAFDANQAEIGISVGNYLARSYAKCGGLNFEQASISTTTTMAMTAADMERTASKYHRLTDVMTQNVEADKAWWQAKLKKVQATRDGFAALERRDAAICELEDLIQKADDEGFQDGNTPLQDMIAEARQKLTEIVRIRDQNDFNFETHVRSLRTLAINLDEYVPSTGKTY